MDQKEFESAIANYVTRQVDKNNPQIVEFELVREFRRKFIKVTGNQNLKSIRREPKIIDGRVCGNAIITPFGRFESVSEASQALGIKNAAIYYRLKTMEGYEYEE